MVTVTGRWSCTNPPIGQIPRRTKEVRQIKAAFIDHVEPVEIDLSWAEQRVLDQAGEV